MWRRHAHELDYCTQSENAGVCAAFVMLDWQMRIFVGLDLSEEIRGRIAQFMAEVRGMAPDVRWVAPESLHVTLKFVGEKPDAIVSQVQESLVSISAPSFEIAFRGCGFFPTAKSARVFWIGMEGGAALPKLAYQIEDVLAGIGIPKEERAFSPHLTLARVGSGAPQRKKADHANSRFAMLQQRLTQIPATEFGTMLARDFFLYRSQLSSQGSRYTKIARFTLRSPEQ